MFRAFTENRRRFFWILQSSGWLAYVFLNYFQGRSYGATADYIYTSMLYAIAGFVLTLGLRYIYRAIWDFRPTLLFFLASVAMVSITSSR
jgi:two-component system LytT family sensor kinase